MDLFLHLGTLPLWLVIIPVLGLTTAVAVLATFYVRRRVSLERLVVNNEVAGFKYATLGVIYAVLLAFAVIMVWESYRDTEGHVDDEAGTWAALHHLASGFPEHGREAVQQALREYATAAVGDEWPAMARGAESAATAAALSRLYLSVLTVEAADAREAAILSAALDQLALLSESRRDRLDKARGAVPPLLGLVLLIGAVLTVGFTLFFGAPNINAQGGMTGILCAMIMLVLLVVIALNHPFAGRVRVAPDPIERALADAQAGLASEGLAAPGP